MVYSVLLLVYWTHSILCRAVVEWTAIGPVTGGGCATAVPGAHTHGIDSNRQMCLSGTVVQFSAAATRLPAFRRPKPKRMSKWTPILKKHDEIPLWSVYTQLMQLPAFLATATSPLFLFGSKRAWAGRDRGIIVSRLGSCLLPWPLPIYPNAPLWNISLIRQKCNRQKKYGKTNTHPFICHPGLEDSGP